MTIIRCDRPSQQSSVAIAAVSLTRHTSTLPHVRSSLVGRDQVAAEVRGRLLEPAVALLTLTGPGGVGKTRLALQVASDIAPEFADVYFVELAAVAEAQLVATTLAHALGVRDPTGPSAIEHVKALLGGGPTLLILDNFEHLLAAAPELTELLVACPRLKLLVTSRAALHISGENTYLVPPLAYPRLTGPPTLAAIAASAAVQLFVDRARAADRSFVLDETNAAAVAEICRRLDGLPLAIELAAARVSHLPPVSLLARFAQSLPLLTGGSRDQPLRLQTMRNTVVWSYDLLPPGEQRLFRHLSVFAGGFTLEAAEYVGTEEGDDTQSVIDLVAALLDKSLLQKAEFSGGEPRFTMLETIREFGMNVLAASGEAEHAQQRCAHFLLGLVEQSESELWGPDQRLWLDRLEAEYANLRAALAADWTVDLHLRLAAALWWFWSLTGRQHEGRAWLERVLRSEAPAASLARGKAFVGAGALAIQQQDFAHATELLEAAQASAPSPAIHPAWPPR